MARREGKSARGGAMLGFSLVELLVVIGIIGILIGLLIPTVTRVRRAAWDTSSKAMIAKLQGAIEKYYQDFNAYPGPIPNSIVGGGSTASLPVTNTTAVSNIYWTGNAATGAPDNSGTILQATVFPAWNSNPTFPSITGSNNLLLGLLGGMTYNTSTGVPEYNPSLVGAGPATLNPAGLKTTAAYMNVTKGELSWRQVGGKTTGSFAYGDGNGPSANDSIIPCFVDAFPDPLPILYLCARVGASLPAGANSTSAQYDIKEVIGYTSSGIGLASQLKAGRRHPSLPVAATPTTGVAGTHGLRFLAATSTFDKGSATNYYYPYDFGLYVTNPAVASSPRAKDSYILIGAGVDRVYGTNDDSTTFGQVLP